MDQANSTRPGSSFVLERRCVRPQVPGTAARRCSGADEDTLRNQCGLSSPPQPPPLVPDGVSKRVPRPDADCPIMFSLTRGTRVSGPWQHPSGCAAAAGRQDSDGTAAAPVAGPSERGPGTAESAPLRPNAGIQAAIRVVKAGAQSRTHRSKTIPCDHMEPFSI